MTSSIPRAAVVVVSYDSAALLEANLATTDWSAAGIDVVVVDNFAGAPARAAVEAVARTHGWTCVAEPTNLGFGAGVNRGVAAARAAGADVVVLLNPDAVADVATVTTLVGAVRAEPGTAVSPRVASSDGRYAYEGSQWRERDGAIRGIGPRTDGVTLVRLDAPLTGRFDPATGPVHGWLTGACLAVATETFDAVGGFDEEYFLYWEDIDLSWKLQAAGFGLAVRLDLTVLHDEGGTHPGGSMLGRGKSDLFYRWNCRNRLAFAARRLPRRTALGWLLRTPTQTWAVLMGGGRRQLLHHPQAAWAALRGSGEGAWLVLRRVVAPFSGDTR